MTILIQGFVTINGNHYPAEQEPSDGNSRKQAVRYFRNGAWSEWCKDDHDIFVALDPRRKLGMEIFPSGAWSACRLPLAVWSSVINLHGTNVELAKDGEDILTFVHRVLRQRRRDGKHMAEPTLIRAGA
jgi:hypothetical protein